eukprot:Protomagalhaensia_sp_Gyna_25__2639@NODE_2501_length_1049_cov_3941_806931_g2073_i0_p2_GENE_NODE_2501_length_1049_cov_3941_806931_g2073_i0NODE_2501_length_1049_cov_3941_806931_g2073_i0_p2_ORF_typecomplete_len108_score24_61C2/PF00168_30/1e11_NODE_2501_length_1049_cov_3941_806931_g2073_i098421
MPKTSGFRDKTDAYVEVQVGGQKNRTSTKVDAGSEAQFNEVLTFTYSGEPTLTVNLYDDEKKKDDLLGSGHLELSPNVLQQGFRGVIQAKDKKDRSQGDVLLHIQAL